ncbi:unnamed protein product [Bathycoccus prasinos]
MWKFSYHWASANYPNVKIIRRIFSKTPIVSSAITRTKTRNSTQRVLPWRFQFDFPEPPLLWTHETDAPKLLDPKTGKETNRVHTYGKTWALQSVEYESVVYKRPVFEAVKGFFFKKKK